ncbi:MAG: LacI family DNA-binding transcriptional regulator [Solirubrobacteraceae bacterium]
MEPDEDGRDQSSRRARGKSQSTRRRSRRTPETLRPATIRDVAALCGLSIATVTRVFQGSQSVREETKARVLESADRLGYRPNSIARALSTGTSNTIGVLIRSLVDPYWAEIANAIERRAGERGCSVLLASSQGRPDLEREKLETFFDNRVDGVIVGGVSGEPNRWPHPGRQIPTVMLLWDSTPQPELLAELSNGPLSQRLRMLPQETLPGEWLAHVSTDDAAGGALIARHLLELGHRRFAFLVPPPVRSHLLRLLGMRMALEDAGVSFGAVLPTADTFENGRAIATQLLRGNSPPTALVCATDVIAVGAISAADELGVRVPADVSIVGYDDIDLASYVNPPLTTLRNPMRQLGETALDLLLSGRAGETGAISHRLTGVLMARGSTGPAPIR